MFITGPSRLELFTNQPEVEFDMSHRLSVLYRSVVFVLLFFKKNFIHVFLSKKTW
jgi:hypothetical protein